MILTRSSFLRPQGAPLPSCPSHTNNPEGFVGAARCFPCCLAARELVIEKKKGGSGISLLLKSLSPAMQRVPFVGAGHTCRLRSAARTACSRGHGLLNTRSLALRWGKRVADRAAHTEQRAGTSQSTEGQLLCLQPSKTRTGLPIKGERSISRRCSYREGESPVERVPFNSAGF